MQDKIDKLPFREPAEPGQALKHNLPAQLTSFIGREQEIAAACALLRRPEVRLLTLTGPGGVGKTRLALQIATDLLEDFTDGISFVSLAPISGPDLVFPIIVQSLGLRDRSDRPILEQMKAYLHKKHFLLLLDNFEQVLAAAPQLADLLSSCPQLKMLVTSRAALRIQGEYEFPVPPLALPDLKQLPDDATVSQYPAVALFLQRAQAIKPGFNLRKSNARVIVEICTRLDGLPLAIELAAARIKLLPPPALLARLNQRLQVLIGGARNLPARQQTLRNTIQWSYDLLDEEEQRLFRRLAMFVGGCTLEAAETVYGALGDEAGAVLDCMESLIDKSLLQQIEQEEEPRFVMLETIREYGLECLIERGEMEGTQQAHAIYYLSLLEKAWQNPLRTELWRWYAHLLQEYGNLRATLHWSVEQVGIAGAETVLRLSLELLWFWLVSGYLNEGRNFLQRALAHSEEGMTLGRARGLLAAGTLAFTQDDYEQAETLLRQSQVVYQKLADQAGVGTALQKLGQVALVRGDYPLACRLSEEALAHLREARERWSTSGIPITLDSAVGDKWLMFIVALALDTLVRVAIAQGEFARARALAEESLALCRQADNRRDMAVSLFHLSLLTFAEGKPSEARSLAEKSLAISREIHYQWSHAFSLGLLGLVALWQGDEPTACALLKESLMVRVPMEDRWSIRWGLYCLGWVAFERWDGIRGRDMYEKLLRILGQLDDSEFLATCLEGLGNALAAQDPVESSADVSRVGKLPRKTSTQWAVRLWGTAEAFREASGVPLLPCLSPPYERTLATVRARLSEDAFTADWAIGRAMTPEQAIAALHREEMPPQASPIRPSEIYPAGLTQREMEILRLVADGLSDAQIAERLVISYRTVTTHLSSIYNKLGVSSRSAATRFAVEQQLV